MKSKSFVAAVVLASSAFLFVGAGANEQSDKPFPSPLEMQGGGFYTVDVVVDTGDRYNEYSLMPVRVGELNGRKFLFGEVREENEPGYS